MFLYITRSLSASLNHSICISPLYSFFVEIWTILIFASKGFAISTRLLIVWISSSSKSVAYTIVFISTWLISAGIANIGQGAFSMSCLVVLPIINSRIPLPPFIPTRIILACHSLAIVKRPCITDLFSTISKCMFGAFQSLPKCSLQNFSNLERCILKLSFSKSGKGSESTSVPSTVG